MEKNITTGMIHQNGHNTHQFASDERIHKDKKVPLVYNTRSHVIHYTTMKTFLFFQSKSQLPITSNSIIFSCSLERKKNRFRDKSSPQSLSMKISFIFLSELKKRKKEK
jgi:hypothetical protein